MSLTLLLRIFNDNLLTESDAPDALDPVTRIIDEGVSKHISSQVPGFVSADKPKFVAFMEAYYEWLERKENAYAKTHTLYEIGDIDRTIDEFVDYFTETYLKNFPTNLATNSTTGNAVDRRKLLKNIKSFYRAKGSEKSFQLLFRLLYDVPVEFYYPKNDILRVSDGRWVEPKSIKVTRNNTDNDTLRLLEGKQITQYADDGKFQARAVVDSVLIYDDGAYKVCELFLTDILGEFLTNRNIEGTVNGQTVKERVWSHLTAVQVQYGGTGYSVGDIISIDNSLAEGTPALLRVEETNTNGEVRRVSIINSGVNLFTQPDQLNPEQYTRDQLLLHAQRIDEGVFNEQSYIDRVNYPQSTLSNPTTRSIVDTSSLTVDARTKFHLNLFFGALIEYPGYYSSNNGKLSSNKFIQDSYYYQDFSYVLKNEISEKKWKSTVKKVLHPSGHEVFGQISIKKQIPSGTNYPTFHSEMRKYEVPLIGHYTPYTLATTEDLRSNTNGTDLYPDGFNPTTISGDQHVWGRTGGELEVEGEFTAGSFSRGEELSTTPAGATGTVASFYLLDKGLSGNTGTYGLLFLYNVEGTFTEGMTVDSGSVQGYLGTGASSVPVRVGNGTVFIEDGLTAHNNENAPLGTSGTEGFTSAQEYGYDRWGIFHHPNTKGLSGIPSGISFAGITLEEFFYMVEGPVFHSDPGGAPWYTGGSTLEYSYPDGTTSGSINNGAT